MILLHDNARPYVTKIVKDTLSALQWEITTRRVVTRLCFLSLISIDGTTLLTKLQNI